MVQFGTAVDFWGSYIILTYGFLFKCSKTKRHSKARDAEKLPLSFMGFPHGCYRGAIKATPSSSNIIHQGILRVYSINKHDEYNNINKKDIL